MAIHNNTLVILAERIIEVNDIIMKYYNLNKLISTLLIT